jgi:hypothetical protein
MTFEIDNIWFEERPFVPTAAFPEPHYVICGFVTGDQAETIGKMKLNGIPFTSHLYSSYALVDVVTAFLYQLDCMFGTPEDPTPGMWLLLVRCYTVHNPQLPITYTVHNPQLPLTMKTK